MNLQVVTPGYVLHLRKGIDNKVLFFIIHNLGEGFHKDRVRLGDQNQ